MKTPIQYLRELEFSEPLAWITLGQTEAEELQRKGIVQIVDCFLIDSLDLREGPKPSDYNDEHW